MNARSRLFAVCALLVTLFLPSGALLAAETVEAQGSALIQDGALGAARTAALQEALRQAVLSVQAAVSTRTAAGSGQPPVTDSTRVWGQGVVKKVEVLREWTEGSVYHVWVRAEVASGGACQTATRYRRKIAAVHFPLLRAQQVHVGETYGFEAGIPHELLRRLAATGHFLTVDHTAATLYQDAARAPSLGGASPAAGETVMHLAEALGVQFVLSGIIRNLGRPPDPPSGWLAGLLQGPGQRRLEVEVFVHDGLTGSLLIAYQAARVTRTGAGPDASVPFGTWEFFASGLGHALDDLLDELVETLVRRLACVPFSARIISAEHKTVHIDAGATSRLQAGDTLTAFTLGNRVHQANRQMLGYQERPAATLTVREVQPQSATGELEIEADLAGLRPGDVVRAW